MPVRSWRRAGTVLVAVAMTWSIIGCQPKGASPALPPSGGLVVERVEVIDGDTVAVAGPGGDRQRVRIIGIDTPEVAHDGRPRECWAQEATGALRALTEQADEVRLVEDDAVGDRDDYGRLLRQVFVDDIDVGEQLLAAGHARRYKALSTASPVAARYRLVERQARTAGAGLWGACPRTG